MIRTQIQLPDDLHASLKGLAKRKEWTMAELIRRAAELYLAANPASDRSSDWSLPVVHSSRILVNAEDLRESANQP